MRIETSTEALDTVRRALKIYAERVARAAGDLTAIEDMLREDARSAELLREIRRFDALLNAHAEKMSYALSARIQALEASE